MDYQQERRRVRVSRAVYLSYVEDLDQNEIAERLDVSQTAVSNYLNDPELGELHEHIKEHAAYIRLSAVDVLKEQLTDALAREKAAEEVTEDWAPDEEGRVETVDEVDDDGRVTDRTPLPEGYVIEADEEVRAEARKETREILQDMLDIVEPGGDHTVELATGGDGASFEISTSMHESAHEEEDDDAGDRAGASTDGGTNADGDPEDEDDATAGADDGDVDIGW